MRSILIVLIAQMALSAPASLAAGQAPATGLPAPSALDIEPVWSGHSVGFSLLTRQGRQFAAYYDAQRRMTVAQRDLGSDTWIFTRLPTQVGWDSHNYVTMAFDEDGCLHVSGNMHCVPLIYFKASKPGDATSLERITTMVDPAIEKRVTYPVFFRGPTGQLIFRYRDGGSGKGNDIYNAYDLKSRSWRRLLDTPLTDGQGRMNAYFAQPTLGPDGVFHVWGVWRDTPDCATNHHLSYARSRDLLRWEKGDGQAIRLPITVHNVDIVDPTPPGGGLLNGLSALGFDAQRRPIISYHKYDAAGGSQIFCARLEDGTWRPYQVTDWKDIRFDFKGGGSLPGSEVGMGAVTREADGSLTMSLRNPKENRTWVLDETTLKPVRLATAKPGPRYPAVWNRLESTFPGMQKRRCESQGDRPDPRVRHALCWEALPANRDRPREGALPEPAMLRLCTLVSPP